ASGLSLSGWFLSKFAWRFLGFQYASGTLPGPSWACVLILLSDERAALEREGTGGCPAASRLDAGGSSAQAGGSLPPRTKEKDEGRPKIKSQATLTAPRPPAPG